MQCSQLHTFLKVTTHLSWFSVLNCFVVFVLTLPFPSSLYFHLLISFIFFFFIFFSPIISFSFVMSFFQLNPLSKNLFDDFITYVLTSNSEEHVLQRAIAKLFPVPLQSFFQEIMKQIKKNKHRLVSIKRESED